MILSSGKKHGNNAIGLTIIRIDNFGHFLQINFIKVSY